MEANEERMGHNEQGRGATREWQEGLIRQTARARERSSSKKQKSNYCKSAKRELVVTKDFDILLTVLAFFRQSSGQTFSLQSSFFCLVRFNHYIYT